MAAQTSWQGITIHRPDGLSEDQLASFKPFSTWITNLQRSLSLQSQPSHPFHSSPYALRSITIQSYDLFSSSRLGFLKLTAEVKNPANESLPAATLLRGPSVAMLVILVPEDAPEERYVVLTVQPRVPAGSLAFVEIPAGMVDGEGNFKGVAAKEIEEELGMVIKEDQLTCLSDLAVPSSNSSSHDNAEGLPAAMFPSAGGCDEHVTIYAHERRVPRAQLEKWTGKLTGLRDHGEKITLKLVAMGDLWKEGARDAKALAALALWEGARREGKL